MAVLHEVTNELHLKVIYAGAAGSGKTTNLQSLYKQTSGEMSSRLFDLHSLTQRNTFFDFLPLALGETRNHALRLHLYTLPAHELWETVNYHLLTGIDGIAFVVDSRLGALDANFAQLKYVRGMMQQMGLATEAIPWAFQYNHRDAADALPVDVLKPHFSAEDSEVMEAVAVQDIGVLETIQSLVDRILNAMEPASLPGSSLTGESGSIFG